MTDLHLGWSEKERLQVMAEVLRMSADITRLRAENERLRTALEPFSKASDGFDTMPVKNPEEWFAYGGVKTAGQDAQGAITVGDLRRARAALGGDA